MLREAEAEVSDGGCGVGEFATQFYLGSEFTHSASQNLLYYSPSPPQPTARSLSRPPPRADEEEDTNFGLRDKYF
eukprot:gene15220-biopygen4199